jgi:hydrogenase expression/formation protein HypC
MCLGIPGRLIERLPGDDALETAIVEFGAIRRKVCVACVPEAVPGDYVIVHAGIAISRLDADEAERLLEHLRAMGELEVEMPPDDGELHEVPR